METEETGPGAGRATSRTRLPTRGRQRGPAPRPDPRLNPEEGGAEPRRGRPKPAKGGEKANPGARAKEKPHEPAARDAGVKKEIFGAHKGNRQRDARLDEPIRQH